ncbi:ubiquitin-like-specific protease 2B isoform X1 [Populus alba x Populus x berolinensis]|uniref:Ubiquitin-like-specific protease 2B isoform X1 n=1 Tax=Populus alba x Populus x berolinensis TaxID=444605 RepID=A0AAD6REX4_9ROSI|nr:ubiquitin-like-specific protease 2B isoform X1 [Populus alba x Populus x berolinensis]
MKNGLEVFDFKEGNEIAELAAVAQECDVPGKESGSLVCVDADAIGCDNADTGVQPGTVRDELITEEGNSGSDAVPQLTSLSHDQGFCFRVDDFESKRLFSEHETIISCHEAPLPRESQLNRGLRDSPPSSSEADDGQLDVDDHMEDCSPSSPTPDITEASVILNGPTPTNCFSYAEVGGINLLVDYVVYRGKYCSGCVMMFSYGGVKINGATAHGDGGTFGFEVGIDDIVSIESQNLQRFGTVTIKLNILSKDAVQADTTHGMSGVEELEVAVVEPNWSRKWEEISSLNLKYSALLSVIHDMDIAMDGVDLLQQRRYFPSFDVEFEDVIYPKGDSDAVSISKRDVDLLQPETFINDTIIDFYIKYLKNQIPPEEKHRYHFFNSFFFRKLADLDKDPSSVKDGRAAFLRVHKWTRKVDIFGKDYIFIPVNFNLHWSLLVICHPGEVAGVKDEDTAKSVIVPCILHLDSIKGTHAGLKNLVQSYLWEEWKVRQKDTSEDVSSKFLNLRFVPLELPQQENSFDCGLFLLHYLELFLVEAPVNFSPFRINEFNKFLNGDWFPPAEASLKRTLIQRLISELLQNRSREVSSGGCSNERQSDFSEMNGKESGLGLVSERCTPAGACHVNLSSSDPGQGIEITLLEASSVRNSHCVDDSGLVLREFFEPGVAAGSLLAQCPSFNQSSSYYHLNDTMSQIEQDDTETGEQFVYFSSGEAVFEQIAGIPPQDGSISCSFRGFGADDSWNPGISLQADDKGSSSETSDCASDDSDVGIIENCRVKEDVGLCQKEKSDQQTSSLMENIECLTTSLAAASSEMLENPSFGDIQNLECSEDTHRIDDGNENVSLASCQGNFSATLQEDNNLVENVAEVTQDDMQTIEGIHNLEGIDDTDRIGHGNENGNLASCQENLSASLQEDHALLGNGLHQDLQKTEATENDMQMFGGHVIVVESDEQQAAKRPRLAPPHEVDGEITRSLSKDLCL